MDENWIPLLVVSAVVIIVIAVMGGLVGRAAMRANAIKAQAQADAENGLRYQELAERCAAGSSGWRRSSRNSPNGSARSRSSSGTWDESWPR